MRALYHSGKWFLVPFLLMALVLSLVLIYMPKGDEILFIQTQHTDPLNIFFRIVTSLSEWPMVVIIILFSLVYGWNKGMLLTAAVLVNALLVTILKKGVFAGYARPALFFQDKFTLHFVPGVETYKYNSFPSGHTAAAFALFFMISLVVKDRRWSLLFFVLAVLIGFSRVYLLQHFLMDVYAGSILGLVVSGAIWQISTRFSYFGTSTPSVDRL